MQSFSRWTSTPSWVRRTRSGCAAHRRRWPSSACLASLLPVRVLRCADHVIIGLLTLATHRSQETASAAIYTAFSRTSTLPCRPTLPPTTSKRFAKSLTCVARCTRAFLRCLTCAHRCQDRTNDATSGRQKQPVYVTRVDVVQKQTLWNYQVRCSFGRHGTSDHRASCACSVRKAGLS